MIDVRKDTYVSYVLGILLEAYNLLRGHNRHSCIGFLGLSGFENFTKFLIKLQYDKMIGKNDCWNLVQSDRLAWRRKCFIMADSALLGITLFLWISFSSNLPS